MIKYWLTKVKNIMKISAFILYILVHGVCVRFCSGNKNVISVGLLVDMGSWDGKVIESCITNAISDSYDLNSKYETRIALHTRDSRGDSLHSINAALDLLENVQVDVIIVPRIDNQDLLLAQLANKGNVPLLSFSSALSTDEHPYLLQVGEDESTEFHAISALINASRWRTYVILYEDTSYAMQIQCYLRNIQLENHMDDVHQEAIALRATSGQLIHVIRRLVKMKASVFIVHMSPSLASQVFANAKDFGLMSEGYAWIVTSKTMNHLVYQNSSVYESMQGTLGLKSHISNSNMVQNFSFRSKSDFHPTNVHVYDAWAYDAIWAVAKANERTRMIDRSTREIQCKLLDPSCEWISHYRRALLSQLSSSKFAGVAGPFQLMNRKIVRQTYEIVNVIGNGKRRVGFWTSSHGLTQSHNSSTNTSLETIIWPGISTTVPSSLLPKINGKVLRIVIPGSRSWPELVNWHYDPQTNVTTADGFCIDLFHAALDWLHLNVTLEFVPSNATYNDLVYQVFLKKYDAAVGDIAILSNRSEYVDFTLPFTDLGAGMVVKHDKTDPWFFLKPIDRDLWITSISLFLLVGIVVWLIERPVNEEFRGSWVRQVGTILCFAFSTLFYNHRERLQRNLSRFVVGVWLFVVLILISSYTANLSSLLTVQQFKLAKKDYVGYSVVTVVDNLNITHNSLPLRWSPEEYHKALKRGSRNGGVDAIVDEIPYMKIFLSRYPHDYAMVQTAAITSGFGFAFPKGSLLVHEVSRAIAAFRERGVLLEMEKKWLTSQSSLLTPDAEPSSTKTLSIHDFLGLFIVNGICQSIAIVVFLILLLCRRSVNPHSIFRI